MAVRQRQSRIEDEVENQGRFLLNHFVYDQMQNDAIENAPKLAQLEGADVQMGMSQEHLIEIGRAIRFVGDAIKKDQEFQSLVARVPPGAGEATLLRVANSIFADGIFNWGRVVALFNFAYTVCVRAVNSIDVMRSIINIIIGFIRTNVVQWIVQNGGWAAILDYMNSSKRRFGYLVAGGLAICAGAFLYQRYSS